MHQFEKEFQLEIWKIIKQYNKIIDEEDILKALECIKLSIAFRIFTSLENKYNNKDV